MIIDAHTHIGKAFWGDFSEEYLKKIVNKDVDFLICSNLAGIDWYTKKDEKEANLEILHASTKYKKIKPLLVCQPERSKNANKIKNLLETYPEFIGMKFHPEFTKLPADSDKYNAYLELAEKYNKPCLFHSGDIGSEYSSPHLIYKKAKEFPKLPIILGHLSNGEDYSQKKAIEILIDSIETKSATLYTDTSWLSIENVILLIEKLKNTSLGDYTHRILWASDAPVGDANQTQKSYSKNLNNFKVLILEHFKDENLLNNLLFYNAKNLFKL